MDGGDRRDQPIAAPDFALHVQPSGSSKHDGFVVRLRVQPLGPAEIAARVQAVKPIVAPGAEQERGHAAGSRAIAQRSHGAIRHGPLGLRSQPPRKAATVCTRFPATAGSTKRPMNSLNGIRPHIPFRRSAESPQRDGKEGGMSLVSRLALHSTYGPRPTYLGFDTLVGSRPSAALMACPSAAMACLVNPNPS